MSSVSIGPEKNGLVLHGDSKAKPDSGIDAVMNREIWLRLQLVAICGISCTWRSQSWYTSIVDNTGIKNYSSIVIFLQKKYNTGIKSYSSIVNNTVRK